MKAKTVLLLILAILAAVPVLAGGWLIYYDGPYTGKLIDAETGQPIEGAAVLGIWHLQVYAGIEVQLKYLGAREAVTDKEGYFEVPKVVGFNLWPLARLGKPSFTIFKPGYDSYPPYDSMKPGITGMEQKGFLEKSGNLIALSKVMTTEERIKVLIVSSPTGVGSERLALEKRALRLFGLIKDEQNYLTQSRGKQ